MIMNPIDWLIDVVNPQASLKRTQARLAHSVVQRKYEAATSGRRNTGWFRRNTSAASEVSEASDKLAGAAQELCRNNPLAKRVKMVWASSMVGAGIRAELTTSNKKKNTKINDAFSDWAESVNCDFEGGYNFYGLQWLWAATVVESGGVFVRKHINSAMNFPLQLQTIEQSYLDKSKNNGSTIVDGIQFTKAGQIEGYWLYTDKSGLNVNGDQESKYYKRGEEIIHIYRKERSGQHLGVSWLAQSATMMNKYDTLQDAKIMQQQIAACLGLIVEEGSSAIGVGDSGDSLPDALEAGMIEYVKAGTKVHTISPPQAHDSGQFITELKSDMAVGADLTYSQLTGDYSKFNFASGRMGKIDFFSVLDHAQMLMLKPALDAVFTWYKDVNTIVTGGTGVIECDWVFPPRQAVNPKEELDTIITRVRAGLMSPSKAAKQMGERLPKIIAAWQADKQLFGDLPFDLDPSKFSAAGNQLDDNDAAASNVSKPKSETDDDRAFSELMSAISRGLNEQ